MRELEAETIRAWICGLDLTGDDVSIREGAVELVDDYIRLRITYEPWTADDPLMSVPQVGESDYERYEETGEIPDRQPSTLALVENLAAYAATAAAAGAVVVATRLVRRLFG